MAKSKSTIESRKQDLKAEKEAKYNAARKKLFPLPWLALALLVVVVALNFLHWTDIYNTDIPGVEVSASGWAYAAAGITGDYNYPGSIYGDLSVPFYYYTDYWCQQPWCTTLSALTLAATGVMLAAIVLMIVTGAAKKYFLSVVAAVVSLVGGGLYIACQNVAVSMKDGQILAVFCSGNPACSIRSFAMIPAIVAIIAAAFCAFIFVKDMQTKKLLK